MKVHLTEQVLMSNVRRYWWRRWRRNMCVKIGWACTLLLCFLAFPHHWLTWVYAGMFVYSVVYLVVSYLRTMRKTRLGFAQFGERELMYRVTDESLQVESPHGKLAVPWDKFGQLWRFEDAWLLFSAAGSFEIFPANLVKGEVGQFLMRKVRENGGKVK